MINFITAIVLIALPLFANAQKSPQIAASIKPIHSIAANITDGISEPYLILDGNTSPHHYALKPSDVRQIANADIIIMVSEEIESFLTKPLANLAEDKIIIELTKISGLQQHPTREAIFQYEQEHDHHHGEIDPHIWLSPLNAIRIAEEITSTLSHKDPGNAHIYNSNLHKLKATINRHDRILKGKLAPYSTNAFVVFHDAYQYFEKHYWLNSVGAIIAPSEGPMGARRLREIEGLIKEKNIKCMFSEPQFSSSIIEKVAKNNNVNIGLLDPLGTEIEAGKNAYLGILDNIANNVISCLRN